MEAHRFVFGQFYQSSLIVISFDVECQLRQNTYRVHIWNFDVHVEVSTSYVFFFLLHIN